MFNPIQRLREKLDLKRAYMDVFSGASSADQGQQVLRDILSRAGVTRPNFTSDPNLMQHNEGMRRLAMSIFRQVYTSMDQLPALLVEEMQKLEQEKKEQ